MKFKRIFLLVLDSLGVGEAIDADDYNDKGVSTLGHLASDTDLFIPNLDENLDLLIFTSRSIVEKISDDLSCLSAAIAINLEAISRIRFLTLAFFACQAALPNVSS